MKALITAQAFLSKNYWRYTFFSRDTVIAFFAALGVLWGIIEPTSFFLGDFLRGYWKWFLIGCVLCTFWLRKPMVSVSNRLESCDVDVEIRISSIFDVEGDYIISTNTTFDTDLNTGLIEESSLQGQFTRKFYDTVKHLDCDLEKALAGENETENLNGREWGKSRRYRIGTVAQLKPKNRRFYLVAIAEINEYRTAQSSFENVRVSLASLWEYIGSRGGIEPLVIPLIGTGRSRIQVKREMLVREILKSFVAACAAKKFCEKLTLVISPHDYRKQQLNLYELRDYLQYVCRYTEFKSKDDVGTGTGIQ